jgi:hypothetical protein
VPRRWTHFCNPEHDVHLFVFATKNMHTHSSHMYRAIRDKF